MSSSSTSSSSDSDTPVKKPVDVKTSVMNTKSAPKEDTFVDELVPSGAFSPGTVVIYCLLAAIPGIIFSIGIGYTAHMNTIALRNEYIPSDFLSLYSSMLTIGAVVGSILSGFYTMDVFGRKYSIFVSAIFSFIGFAMHLALIVDDINIKIDVLVLLVISRLISGIGIGMGIVAAPVYIAEVSPIKMFHFTSVFNQVYIGLGFVIIFVTSFGTDRADTSASALFTSYRQGRIWLPGISMIFCFIQAVAALIIPHSPMWLISKKKYLKNDGEMIRKNNIRLYRSEYNYHYLMGLASSPVRANNYNFAILSRPTPIKILFITFMCMFYQQFSGINPILFNASDIFSNAGLNQETLGLVILGFAQFFGALIGFVVNSYVGKKTILLATSLVSGIVHLIFGIHTRFWATRSDLSWLPVLLLVIFLIVFNMGWGPIPFIINSIFHPDEITNLASGLGIMFNWMMAFVITYPYFIMQDTMGLDGVFFFFSAIMFSAVLATVLFIPEFRGKPKEQIIEGINRSLINTKFSQ